MSDDENDEDLKRAIALSLQESSPPPTNNRKIVIEISDDEDDDLDAPLTARTIPPNLLPTPEQNKPGYSKDPTRLRATEDIASMSMEASTIKATATSGILTEDLSLKSGPPKSGLLGLDRKQMEQERLARLNASKPRGKHAGAAESKKRKAELVFRDDPNGRNVKAKTPADAVDYRSQPATSGTASHSLNHNSGQVPPSGLQYPNGVVKMTWVDGYDRDGTDITIEEVLQKDSLELAVLSAFQIDAEWISDKLLEKTKVVWVLQAKSEAEVRIQTYRL
jgi:hypothetical protein